MNNYCNECQNKDVCKWITLFDSTIEYYENTDKSAPLNIQVECIKKRRSQNA